MTNETPYPQSARSGKRAKRGKTNRDEMPDPTNPAAHKPAPRLDEIDVDRPAPAVVKSLVAQARANREIALAEALRAQSRQEA